MGTAFINSFIALPLMYNLTFFTELPLTYGAFFGLFLMAEITGIGILRLFCKLSLFFIAFGIGLHPVFIFFYQIGL